MTMPGRRYHILLIGGTGICGLIFAQAAIQSGHFVTLYVRTPSKVPLDLSSHSNAAVIQGELGDEEGLKKAAACGADTFVSLAGPTMGERQGTVWLYSCCNDMEMMLMSSSLLRMHSKSSIPSSYPPVHSPASSSSQRPPTLLPKTRDPLNGLSP